MRIKIKKEELFKLVLEGTYAKPFDTNNKIGHSDIIFSNMLKPNSHIENKLLVSEGGLMFAPKCKVIPTVDILNYLGYTKIQVTELLNNFASFNRPIILVGFGGFGAYRMYWLEKLHDFISSDALRNKTIHIFDKDEWELRNMGRFPFLSDVFGTTKKAKWYREYNRKHKKVGLVKSYSTWLKEQHIQYIYQNTGRLPIVIGSPDVETRMMLSKSKYCDYITTSHLDDKLNMWINPIYEDIPTDTYGYIYPDAFGVVALWSLLKLLEVLPLLNSRTTKMREHKIFTGSFSRFVKANDPENIFNMLPVNYTYSMNTGYLYEEWRD